MRWEERNYDILLRSPVSGFYLVRKYNTLINPSIFELIWTKDCVNLLLELLVNLHTHNQHVICRNQWFLLKIQCKKSSSKDSVELSILCKNRFLLYNLDFLFCCSANCRIFGTEIIHMAGDLSSLYIYTNLSYKITSNTHWIYKADKRILFGDEPCVKTSDGLCGRTRRTNRSDDD